MDILVNNAGVNADNLSLRMKEEEWKKVIDINLTSTFLLCKHSIKKMLKNKFGRIVNITSVVGHTGNVGQTNYSASKAGIIGLAKWLATWLANSSVRVNVVTPGGVFNNHSKKFNKRYSYRTPLNRMARADDLVGIMLFLMSDASSYATGQNFIIDGGYTAW